MNENKPLTAAQSAHLAMLYSQKQQIEQELQRFVTYLSIEHNAPAAEGWTQIDVELGFVRSSADNKHLSPDGSTEERGRGE